MARTLTALPREDRGWILWDGDRPVAEGRDLSELAGKRSDLLVGLPASQVSTFAVALPAVDSAMLEDMAFAQIERRGLAGPSRELTVYEHEVYETHETETVLVVHVLRPDLPGDLIVPGAAGYAPSALLRRRSGDGAVLWKEGGRYVFALFGGGRLVHSQVLGGAGEFGGGVAREINLVLMSLRADEAIESAMPRSCEVRIEGLTDAQRGAFDEVLRMPATYREAGGAAKRPRGRERLVPLPVLEARKKKRTLLRYLLAGACLLALYAMAGTAVWAKKTGTEREIAALEKRLAIVEPDAIRIQRAAQRWSALEPAFDLDFFPVVQLSRITSAMPGSGVVLREYRTEGRDIRLQGQARDFQLAHRLLEDLDDMEEFAGYTWSMPNPRVEDNNTATFEIAGTPAHEGAE